MKNRWLSYLLIVALLAGLTMGLVACGGGDDLTTTSSAEQTTLSTEQVTTSTEASTTTTAAPVSARQDYFVNVVDLAAAPADFVVIDTRDEKAYAAGHIAGAVNAPWQTFADMNGKPGEADWGTLLPTADIGKALGGLGVDASKTIVVYADPNGWGEDGRVMWTLLSAGVSNVRMLDGGWPAWTAAGNQASTEVVTLPAGTVTVAAELDPSLNVTTDYLKSNLDKVTIVDSRAAKEYDGATDFGEARGGHLPNAVNIPFLSVFNDDGTVKSDADLSAMFEAAGLQKDAEIVSYCTKGIRSGYMTLLLRMLGYSNAKNYDASFYSWAGDSTLPVEK